MRCRIKYDAVLRRNYQLGRDLDAIKSYRIKIYDINQKIQYLSYGNMLLECITSKGFTLHKNIVHIQTFDELWRLFRRTQHNFIWENEVLCEILKCLTKKDRENRRIEFFIDAMNFETLSEDLYMDILITCMSDEKLYERYRNKIYNTRVVITSTSLHQMQFFEKINYCCPDLIKMFIKNTYTDYIGVVFHPLLSLAVRTNSRNELYSLFYHMVVNGCVTGTTINIMSPVTNLKTTSGLTTEIEELTATILEQHITGSSIYNALDFALIYWRFCIECDPEIIPNHKVFHRIALSTKKEDFNMLLDLVEDYRLDFYKASETLEMLATEYSQIQVYNLWYTSNEPMVKIMFADQHSKSESENGFPKYIKDLLSFVIMSVLLFIFAKAVYELPPIEKTEDEM
ncbi:PIN4 [Acrasis kona]|uniref:PIN4 n=1 Tax=Acrasis kona TaxID=1008807 RepID=A0AAW2Z2B4_9EUKA